MTHLSANLGAKDIPVVLTGTPLGPVVPGDPPTFQLLFQGNIPAPVVWSRASAATWWDNAGNMISVPAGTPRYRWESTTSSYGGIYIEPGATNYVRNPRGEGAAGATPPALWGVPTIQGMQAGYTVTWSTGTEQGMPVTYVRVQGTTDGAQNGGQHIFYLESTGIGGPATATNDEWTTSVYLRVSAGDVAGISRAPMAWTNNVRDAGNAIIYFPPTKTITPPQDGTHIADARTFQAFGVSPSSGTPKALEMNFRVYPLPGVPIDYTLAIGCPQAEKDVLPYGGIVSTPILPAPGTHVITTRAADFMSCPLTPAQAGDPNHIGVMFRVIVGAWARRAGIGLGLIGTKGLPGTPAYSGNNTVDIEGYPPDLTTPGLLTADSGGTDVPPGVGASFFYCRGDTQQNTVEYFPSLVPGTRSAIAGTYSAAVLNTGPYNVLQGARNGVPAVVRASPDYFANVFDTIVWREPWRADSPSAGIPMVVEEVTYYPRTLTLDQMVRMTMPPYLADGKASLDLNFLVPGTLPPGVVFTRPAAATYWDNTGTMKTAAANAPRWDYDPATKLLKGLLIEASRTNSLLQSGAMSVSPWLVSGSILAGNATPAPDGTTTATRVTEDTSGPGYHYMGQNMPGVPVNAPATMSVFVKDNTRRYCTLSLVDLTTFVNTAGVAFDLTTGTGGAATTAGAATAASYSIANVGNGWWRLSLTATLSATATTGIIFRLYLSNSMANAAYTGDGVSSLYLWGAQVEAGSYPTSLIPTTTAAVTRWTDGVGVPIASIPGFSQSQGTLSHIYMSKGTTLGYGSPAQLVGSAVATDYIDVDETAANGSTPTTPITVGAGALAGGTVSSFTWYTTPIPLPANTVQHGASSWALNMVVNGAHNGTPTATSNAPATALPVITQLTVGGQMHYQDNWSQWAQRTRYYPQKLTLPQLQALTAAPTMVLDFLNPGTLPPGIVFARASTGSYWDITGTLKSAASGAPRWDYDPATHVLNGLLIEEARTNSARNSTMQGAVVGTPGTLPTGWLISPNAGLTTSVVSLQTVNGMPTIDLRISGTTTGTTYLLFFDLQHPGVCRADLDVVGLGCDDRRKPNKHSGFYAGG